MGERNKNLLQENPHNFCDKQTVKFEVFVFSRFWFFKFLILIGLCVGAFYIPRGDFGTGMDGNLKFRAISLDMFCLCQGFCFTALFIFSVDVDRNDWRICLHPHPADSDRGFCARLERVLGRQL